MTIDTNELRNDAKTAHYGHLPLEVSGSEMLELLDRLEAAEKEREELHALIAAVKKQANAEYRIRVKKEEECALLQAKISDLTINVEYLGNLKKSYEELIGELQDDRDDLRAKIEQMERQEPFAYLPLSSARILESGVIANAVVWNCRDKAASDMPLYALPGAKGEEK